MPSAQQLRTGLMAITSIGISLATVYSLIEPTAGNRSVSAFSFPELLPLSSWQQIDTKSISPVFEPEKTQSELVQTAQSYHYTRDNKDLKVDIHYILGSRGNVDSYLQKYSNISSEVLKSRQIEYIKGVGYYSLFVADNRAYLSSCIGPRSNSSVTQKQFSQNRYQGDLKIEVWKDWLLGKASIRDRRCLWVTISTPNNSSSFLKQRELLEQVWQECYQWWQPRFPQLSTTTNIFDLNV